MNIQQAGARIKEINEQIETLNNERILLMDFLRNQTQPNDDLELFDILDENGTRKTRILTVLRYGSEEIITLGDLRKSGLTKSEMYRLRGCSKDTVNWFAEQLKAKTGFVL